MCHNKNNTSKKISLNGQNNRQHTDYKTSMSKLIQWFNCAETVQGAFTFYI